MATVWEARQLSLERTVAIKVLAPQQASGERDAAMFREEAHSAAKLKHQGIVQIYDANVSDGLSYIVMEYIDGYTVGDWLRRKGTLSEVDALLVAECVADALGYAWEKERLIHCDIKPDNIMVDADGTVKIADLGLARTFRFRPRTFSEEVFGTPSYMSPEQVQGASDLDVRSDIYALGATLYELLAGAPLFDGYTPDEVAAMQLTSKPPPVHTIAKNVSPQTSRLIGRMLAKDRERRPPDWKSLSAAMVDVRESISGRRHGPATVLLQRSRSVKGDHRRMIALHRTRRRITRPQVRESAMPALLPLLVVLLVVGAGIWGASAIQRRVEQRQRTGWSSSTHAYRPAEPDPEELAWQAYQDAHIWSTRNAQNAAEGAARLRAVSAAHSSTRGGRMAIHEAQRIEERLKAAEVRGAWDRLRAQAAELGAKGEFSAAEELLRTYSGARAAETLATRQAAADAYRLRALNAKRELDKREGAVAAQVDILLNTVAHLSIAGRLSDAAELLREALLRDPGPTQSQRLRAVAGTIGGAINIDQRILSTFSEQKGQVVTVDTNSGRKQFVAMGIRDGKIWCQSKALGLTGLRVEIDLDPRDLTPRERLRRMLPDSAPDVALTKGLIAFNSGMRAAAEQYFSHTGEHLAPRLCSALAVAEDPAQNSLAEERLRAILTEQGAEVGHLTAETLASALPTGPPTDRIRSLLLAYISAFGASDFGRASLPSLLEILHRPET